MEGHAQGAPETARPQPAEPSSRDVRASPGLEPAGGARSVLAVQRLAGNQAAGHLAQRVGAGVSGVPALGGRALQRVGEGHQPPPLSATALRRAESLRGAANVRLLKVAAYNERADAAIAAYRDKRTRYAQQFGAAWERHNGVLTRAGEQAATQNLIEGVVVGAVASLVVAAALAAAFPVAASAAAFTATWTAFNTASAVGSSAVGTAAATALGRPGVPPPSAGARDAEADAWRAVADVEHAARAVATAAPKFGLQLGNAEYTIAQVHAHIDGATTDLSWPDTVDLVVRLGDGETRLEAFDSQIDGKLAAMAAFRDAVTAWTVPDVDRLEQEIWWAWMARLTDDEVLDQDEIQHHLVRLGLIPNYVYFSDADQAAAVASARAHVARNAAASRGDAPAPP